MKKALTLRMFPDHMPTLQRLDLARKAGYDGVEVNLEPWQEYSLDTPRGDLARLRAEIEARGLGVTAVYDREQWHFPMSSANRDTRVRCASILQGLMRSAEILGTDTVLVMPGAVDNSILAPSPEVTPYAEAYRNSQEVLRSLGAEAQKRGLRLAAENCPGKFLITPLELARFLDEIGSPAVGAYFDIGNALWYGFPEHWIPVLGKRIMRVHVKDNTVSASGVSPAPLLAGDVDWPVVRSALEAVGYDSWLTAEVLPAWRHHGERLIFDSSAAMDAIFG